MGIEFNPEVNKVNTSGIKGIKHSQNSHSGAIISAGMTSQGLGISVENNKFIADLMKLFSNVPDKPEFNTRQENLVINGAVMLGADEEMAEV